MDNELHELTRAAASPPELGGDRGGLNNGSTTPQVTDDMIEAFRDTVRPQDDVPQEVIERYMIRDYQHMFTTYWEYRELASLTANQIDARARQLVKKSKTGNYVVADLELKLQEKTRKIQEMYGWLSQKDALINSLREHCEKQRDTLSVNMKNLGAQRRQIQSLLCHIGDDGREALADCDASWRADRWKEAMVYINDVQQQLGELREAVIGQPLDEGVKDAILGVVGVIRGNARRAYNRTAHIASPVLRREFAVETVPEDAEEEES